jgi:peptidoglycan/xylan/chitin deacetylase (PgdA/CDA1 family)
MVHGWMHEDLAKLSLEGQDLRLQNASAHLKEVLGIKATVLAPLVFRYDGDTLKATHAHWFAVVSGLAELQQPRPVSGRIVSIPATIELSDFENGT